MLSRLHILLRIPVLSVLAFGATTSLIPGQEPPARLPIEPNEKKAPVLPAVRVKVGAPIATPTAGAQPSPNGGVLPAATEELFAAANDLPPPYRIWGRTDYLFWRMTEAPLPVPLVSTSADADFGILGRASTRTLFGGQPLNLGAFSGARTTVGVWFDRNATVGIELSGFLLEERFSRFSTNTLGTPGSPLLAIPFVDPSGTQRSILLGASPAVSNFSPIAGAVDAFYSTRLWGYETNAVLNLFRSNRCDLSLLAGYRHLDLREEFGMSVTEQFTTTGLQTARGTDSFLTRNRFDGAQLGGRLSFDYNMFSLGLNAKVALGNNRESVQVSGSRSFTLSGGANVPGGIFTQPSNIGTFERNEFRAIPEFGFEISMRLFSNVRLIAGYSAIYWAQVARAGNQIDPVLNIPNIRPAGWVFFNEVFTPAAAPGGGNPAPRFNQSDLWIHGANFGVEVRY